MKASDRILTIMPNARYIVTSKGKVKIICTDSVSKSRVQLNLSKQQHKYSLFAMVWEKGLGKQYI